MDQATRQKIVALHDKGLTQTEIARRVKVAVSTVNLAIKNELIKEPRLLSRPDRCNDCGYMKLYDQCLICRARHIRDQAKRIKKNNLQEKLNEPFDSNYDGDRTPG